jgi:hypothetical protein
MNVPLQSLLLTVAEELGRRLTGAWMKPRIHWSWSGIIGWRHMRHALYWLVVVVSAAGAAAAGAHHSLAPIYDDARRLTLEGVVAQFQFVHPHPYLLIDVVRSDGVKQSWRAEMDNRFELADIGITAQTFKPGDRVVVNGSPGRTAEGILYLWRLDRPADGLRYEQIGSTPHLNAPRPKCASCDARTMSSAAAKTRHVSG